jgi:hypothetical protein
METQMIALLLAAQVAAAPPTIVSRDWALTHPPARNRSLLNTIPEACRQGVTVAAGAPFRPDIYRLGQLPKAHLEIAVERSIGGCPAPIIVRYDVEGDGKAAGGGSGR